MTRVDGDQGPARTLPAGLVAALDRLAAVPRLLVALDFDGVLAPLVDDRDAARPLERSSAALERLAALEGERAVALALVSGRPLGSLLRLASPPRGTALVGSHGAEVRLTEDDDATSPLDEARQALLDDVLGRVREVVDASPGTDVEVKPAGVVLHTRRAGVDVASAAQRAVTDGPGRLPGVRSLRGKDVVELSVLDVDKGRSVQRLREATGAGAVLYAGDDVTDEHAFAVLDPGAGDVGVHVGDGTTAAEHRVADPESFADVLEHLLGARAGTSVAG